MNGSVSAARALVKDIAAGLGDLPQRCDFVVCPPAIHLEIALDHIRQAKVQVAVGGQDCAMTENGAFTGDISAEMLADFGCSYVILGHSERRQHHKESNEIVAAKAAIAHKKGLVAIICVGERENERDAGVEQDVVAAQLAGSLPSSAAAGNTVIAYEPVWAIGTGKTATPEDVRAMHKFIRANLKEKLEDFAQMRILYGGSVKPENAAALLSIENVDGALIGGASLKADQYLGIAKAA